MIIFLIFLGLLYIIFLLLYLSTLEIEIQKFKFNSKNKTNKKVEDYLFYIRLKLLNKFTWIKIKIDNKKINKWTKY